MAAQAARAQAKAPPAMAQRAPVVRRAAEPLRVDAPRPLASLSAIPATPAVQRECSACEAEDKDKDEMPVQPRLEVGPVGDRYEQEADSIAGRVMAMRDGDVSSTTAGVQRACAACSSDDDPRARRLEMAEEDEVEQVRASRDGGSETIAASDSQLTNGGSPLPAGTRDFFEGRMGRDLADVRVHQGGGAQGLSESISARAFTYKNHIWLGANENVAPSFTMAHELAHVMQQTSPGPVGPAPQRIQRVPCSAKDNVFFFPKGESDVGPYHDDTTQWATGKDTELMGEVRVPNASRRGAVTRADMFGFADLVRHDPANLVGMGFERIEKPAAAGSGAPAQGQPQTSAPLAPHPWHTIEKGKGLLTPVNLTLDRPRGLSMRPGRPEFFYRAGKKFSVADANKRMGEKAAPRWGTDDFVRDATTAPTDITVGEVKHGGGGDLSAKAKAQLDHYVTGFDSTAKNYEELRKQNGQAWAGSNVLTGKSKTQNLAKWNLSTGLITKWSGPAASQGWQRLGDEKTLGVARFFGYDECVPCDTSAEFKGHLFAQHDATHGFLWLYAFFPTSANARFTGTARTALDDPGKVAADLNAQLMASPTGTKPVKRPLDQSGRPRRFARAAHERRGMARAHRLAQATHDRRGLARAAPTKKTKPVPKEDPFIVNFEAWKAKQKTLSTDFETLGKSKKGGDAIGALLFDTAMVNTSDITGKMPKEVKGKPPAKTAQKADREKFNTIMLMTGASGRFLGAMRKTFGGAFIRVINIYEKLRDKFREFMDGRKKKGFSKGSRLARAAMKIGGMIFAAIVHHVLPPVAHLLIQCIEQGFTASLQKLFEQDIQELVGDKIDAIETQIAKIEEDVKAAVDKLIGSISDDIVKRYEDILKTWEDVGKLISVAKDIINVVRLATCAAGGLETLGIACVVAGVDFVLGLFDVSPGEALAASLLGTCTAQKLLAEHILTLKEVKELPQTLAQKIVDFVRPVLPSFDVGSLKIDLKDLVCEKVTGSGDLPPIEDITCGSGGSEAGYPEGKSWKPPPDVDPKILNRKPTDEEIKQHGRLPLPGTVPPRPKKTEAPPEPKPGGGAPSPGGGTQSSGGTTGSHSVREGTLDNATGSVNVHYYVHGIGGGFAPREYNGKKETVFITAVDSNAVYYGPDKVDILIYRVFEDPKKKGTYRIDFEPAKDYVLTFQSEEKKTELGFVKRRRNGFVGGPM